jgi:hypothetical protein
MDKHVVLEVVKVLVIVLIAQGIWSIYNKISTPTVTPNIIRESTGEENEIIEDSIGDHSHHYHHNR